MAIRIAIHGFGRIGRSVFRVAHAHPDVRVVAVGDREPVEPLVHLLRYDSVRGPWGVPVEMREAGFAVEGQPVRFVRGDAAEAMGWEALGVDLVVDCTGKNTARARAAGHLRAGARWVVVSAPADDPDITVVLGVNDRDLDPRRHRIISNASCTTNCLAPVLKVLHGRFGVLGALVTTVHAYTNDQRLLDSPHRDLRRARAAGVSIIPTTTGAARSVGAVLPELADRVDGVSVRVPTPNVSLADLTVRLERAAEAAEVNAALREAAAGDLRGILAYTEEPLVSCDYQGCPYSAVVDGLQTRSAGGGLVKLQAWYDNEWGYANRLVELVARLGRVAGAG